ncbi:tubulin polymerization-promoting protein family member 2 isoform X2 [Prionailurus viverrinus]|uniref:tubulin polymerization-promoting protein family member 2 isoform X2 n=1 Tax=Prionailurus viverrinus TaxID=61388 RepID=UPI001FF6A1A7|nr:tubulin polymerization-promoting protein family member 2 isoform X2 [Prionailurus viverrinus]
MASEAGKTFQRFAVFGESSSSGTEMNNKNFSKLCKDCGIMDGKIVTSTDVDIIFSKVKAKNARTITFQQFQEAMKELGQKRFKDKKPDEALENIYKLMEGKDPATTGVTGLSLSRSMSCNTYRRRGPAGPWASDSSQSSLALVNLSGKKMQRGQKEQAEAQFSDCSGERAGAGRPVGQEQEFLPGAKDSPKAPPFPGHHMLSISSKALRLIGQTEGSP